MISKLIFLLAIITTTLSFQLNCITFEDEDRENILTSCERNVYIPHDLREEIRYCCTYKNSYQVVTSKRRYTLHSSRNFCRKIPYKIRREGIIRFKRFRKNKNTLNGDQSKTDLLLQLMEEKFKRELMKEFNKEFVKRYKDKIGEKDSRQYLEEKAKELGLELGTKIGQNLAKEFTVKVGTKIAEKMAAQLVTKLGSQVGVKLGSTIAVQIASKAASLGLGATIGAIFGGVVTILGFVGDAVQRDKCKLNCCPPHELKSQWACKYQSEKTCSGHYSGYRSHGHHACWWNDDALRCEVGVVCRDRTFNFFLLFGSVCPPCNDEPRSQPQWSREALKKRDIPERFYINPKDELVWCAPKHAGKRCDLIIDRHECSQSFGNHGSTGDRNCLWSNGKCTVGLECDDDRNLDDCKDRLELMYYNGAWRRNGLPVSWSWDYNHDLNRGGSSIENAKLLKEHIETALTSDSYLNCANRCFKDALVKCHLDCLVHYKRDMEGAENRPSYYYKGLPLEKGCIRVWEHFWLQGRTAVFCGNANRADITRAGWDNKISSYCVGPDSNFRLYEHNFSGISMFAKASTCSNILEKDKLNDKVKSIEKVDLGKTNMNSGCLTLYEHLDFTGEGDKLCDTVTHAQYFKYFDNKASAYCAQNGADWILYDGESLNGKSFFVKGGKCGKLENFNDITSSIKKLPWSNFKIEEEKVKPIKLMTKEDGRKIAELIKELFSYLFE